MEGVEINAIQETGGLAAGAACMADDAREMILTDEDIFGRPANREGGQADPATGPPGEARDQPGTVPATAPRTFTPPDIGRVFNARFLDEVYCRHWILTAIHGEGPDTCPACHAALTGVVLQRFWEGRRIRCRACGKFFTARTGTFLDGCHMDFREVVLLAVFLHFRIHPREIARILKVSPETVRLWEIKFSALERMKGM
jgi:transposase-like protein